MADRKTVVDALERCARLQDAPMSGECADCAYKESFGTCGSLSKLMMDAAELLKEKPIIIDGNSVIRVGRCPVCKTMLNPWKAGYCWHCGQAVKWDG